jgi:predicted nucleic-acid-binding protein
MIGIDTNALVRHLVQDDPVQSPKATELIEHKLTEENPGFISVVVMAETVWVLERSYAAPDYEIAAAIERILQTEVLVVENEQAVFAAMTALKQGDGSFADALIAMINVRVGCSRTLTFDRKALRLPHFQSL